MRQITTIPAQVFGILVLMDFRKKYFDSLLGALWALISPLVTILLVYFVFRFGLKALPVKGISFLNWLISGMLAWFFISEGLANGIGAFTENKFLVTKIKFPIFILPFVKSTSSFITHIGILTCFLLYLILGTNDLVFAGLGNLIYYFLCSFVLVTAITYNLSTLFVFTKDVSNLLNVMIQLLYWATPIFWSKELLPDKFQFLLLINPVHYIIQGYRDSLFYGISFWDKQLELVVFWIIIAIIIAGGKLVYSKLRPFFADTL